MSYLLVVIWTWFVKFLTPALAISSSLNADVPAMSASTGWIMLPMGVAVGGWAYAVFRQTNTSQVFAEEANWKKIFYVFFLNKGYVDECYEVYFVQPTLCFSNWLWRIVDIGGVDRAVHSVASSSIVLANWLWRVIDIKGIDRVVVGVGGSSVGFGRWLWRVVDVRWLGYNIGQIFKGADAAGQILQETEPRTIQHHLLVMVFWLVSAIGLLYVLV